MSQWEMDFLTTVVSLIATAILYGLRYLYSILRGKSEQIKNATLREALLAAEADAERTIEMLVQAANQTVVAAAKEQNGGKLSESDAKRIKDEVLAKAKQILAPASVQVIHDLKGGIEPYLESLLEATVLRVKK
jgi:hypothetical protein